MFTRKQVGILCWRLGSGHKVVRNLKNRTYVTAAAAATHSEPKWQLIASACITRPPVISPPLEHEEKEYKELVQKLESEGSLKSQHEMRVLEDQIRAHLAKETDSVSLEEAAKQTAAEFEDASALELKNFLFAPKVTEADKIGDQSSLNRALDKSLVLASKVTLGSQQHWMLPQTPWTPGETLRETCDRIVDQNCGKNLKTRVLGNAPCGFYKFKYPKEVRKQGYIGAKVFFFSVHLLSYPLDEDTANKVKDPDLLWLTHSELAEKFNKSYLQAITQFLVLDD